MGKMVIQGFEYLGSKGSFLGEMEAFFVVLGGGVSFGGKWSFDEKSGHKL